MENMILNILGMLGIFGSVMVIRAKNGVHSVLYLVLVFCNIGGIMIMYEIEYIGLVLLMVYVGAVAVLFLFIIMMVGGDIEERKERKEERLIWVIIGIIGIYRVIKVIKEEKEEEWKKEEIKEYIEYMDEVSNIRGIGEIMYTVELYNVLIGGLILLVAIIGGVYLGLYSVRKK